MPTETISWPDQEWKTVRLLGNGSYGAVYEIQRNNLNNTIERCAMKHISIPHDENEIREMKSEGQDQESITRSLDDQAKSISWEYTLMMKLNDCPNVVRCYDIKCTRDHAGFGWDIYIRMELLKPLMDLLSEQPRWNEEQIVQLGKDICYALVCCQKERIIHRDIKPQNIMVSPKGQYKLGDFGIARHMWGTSASTTGIGTPDYMAPEVHNDSEYDSRSDICSLGLVLYWLLNKRRIPFVPLNGTIIKADKELARKRRFSGERIPAPANGTAELKRIVLRACEYDPEDRYQTAEEMLRDLNTLIGRKEDLPPVSDITDEQEEPLPINLPPDDGTEPNIWAQPENAPETVGPFRPKGKPKKESTDYSKKRSDTSREGSVVPTKLVPIPPKPKKWWQILLGVVVAAIILLLPLIWLPGPPPDIKVTPTPTPDTPPALAAEHNELIAFDWETNNDEVIITGYHGDDASVVIPDRFDGKPVTIINDEAFKECKTIRSVVIPDSVTLIRYAAFWGCENLVSVDLPDSGTIIDILSFGDCKSLTSFTISDGQDGIGESTFSHCTQLRSVTIPSSVWYIMAKAFADCDNLSDVYFGGTEGQWNSIDIRSGNEALKNATIHFGASAEDIQSEIAAELSRARNEQEFSAYNEKHGKIDLNDGWLSLKNGETIYIPKGFKAVDGTIPGSSYIFFHDELNMRIYIKEIGQSSLGDYSLDVFLNDELARLKAEEEPSSIEGYQLSGYYQNGTGNYYDVLLRKDDAVYIVSYNFPTAEHTKCDYIMEKITDSLWEKSIDAYSFYPSAVLLSRTDNGTEIFLPKEYLSYCEYKYVRSPGGKAIDLSTTPTQEKKIRSIPERAHVVVLARTDYKSCVIFMDEQGPPITGWCTTRFLTEDYEGE